MKKILLGLAAVLIIPLGLMAYTPNAHAYVRVKGYYRSNSTYVQPYIRSNPNGLRYDNYGYSGGSLYNSTYGTRGSYWNTPTWNTDPGYYRGYNSYIYGLGF